MKVGRTSISSRIISMLLAVVIVLGMVPFSAFTAEAAAGPTTNLGKIQAYAKTLFDANFAKSSDYSEKFTWCTENPKGHKWTYFDGLMVDAYLAMGMTGKDGSILDFASNYYNNQLNDQGVIKRFGNNDTLGKEVDSVPPALGLFDLLGTVADQDRYHKVLHDMYKALQGFDKLTNVGNNFRHKDNTDWADYPFALDGLYMALPFLVEYAKAIEDGRLPENPNNITPSKVYDDVIARLVWVAKEMKDPNTGLYFHGVKENGTDKNGHFWSRGIGWYAVALVDVIGLLPESKRSELTIYLDDLFDGMLLKQHSSGLWYNVTDKDDNLTNNYLETSGTACMAYALMKAYNNGWVTDRKYGDAGLKAFNGIVDNKLVDGKIVDIYRSASVETSDAAYLDTSKMSGTENEAKGVGAVLLAATQVEKTQSLLGTGTQSAAKPTGGMVKAPAGLTVAVNEAPNYSNVKASVVYSDGTIKNVTGSAMTYEPATITAAGEHTVTASFKGTPVGKFTVKAVDSSTPVSADGTVAIESTDSNVDTSAPAATAETWPQVDSGSTTTRYKLLGGSESITDGQYVIVCKTSDTTGIALRNNDATSSSNVVGSTQAVTIDGDYVTIAENEDLSVWTFTASGSSFYVNNGAHWLRGDDSILTKEGSKLAVTFKLTDSATGSRTVNLKSNYYLYYDATAGTSGTWHRNNEANATTVYLYKPTTDGGSTTEAVYAYMTPGSGYAYATGTKNETEILDAIKADYKDAFSVSTSPTGENPQALGTKYPVTYEWENSAFNANASTTTTYNLIAKVNGTKVGTIPVKIYSNKVITNHNVTLSVAPSAVVATVGDDVVTLAGTVTDADTSAAVTNPVIEWKSGDEKVVAVDATGKVTVKAAGTTTITATLKEITINGAAGTINGTIQVVVPVTVAESHTHSYTTVETTKEATCTEAGEKTLTCSCGDFKTETIAKLGHNYVNGVCTRCEAADPNAPTTPPTSEPTTAPTVPDGTSMGITAGGAAEVSNSATVAKDGTLQLAVKLSNSSLEGTTTWASNKPDIASVDETTGVVTGHKAGTAIITATWRPMTRGATELTAEFTVTVTAADTAAAGNVTITTPATGGGTAPKFIPAESFTLVTEATGTKTYNLYTADTVVNGNYVIVYYDSANSTYHVINNGNTSSTSDRFAPSDVTNVTVSNNTLSFNNTNDVAGSVWTVTNSGTTCSIANNGRTFRSHDMLTLDKKTTNSSSSIVVQPDDTYIIKGDNDSAHQLTFSESAWVYSSTPTAVYLYKEDVSGDGSPAVYGKLDSKLADADGNKLGLVYEVNSTADVVADIRNGFTVTAAEDAAGTKNAATVAMDNTTRITIDTTGLDMSAAKNEPYYVPVMLDGVKIGEVPVNVVEAATPARTHEFTVTMQIPDAVTMNVGGEQTVTAAQPTAVVAGTTNAATVANYTITWSSADTTVATVDADGKITGVKEGSTNITGKLTAITINNLTGETTIADTLTVTVPVTVNAATTPDVPTGSYTYVLDTDGIDVGVEYLIVAKTANGEYYALKNVTDKVGSSTNADALLLDVTAGNDKIITIANANDALLSEWYFSGSSGEVNITNTHNTNTNPVYVNIGNAKILNTSSQAYLTAVNVAAGTYHIAKSSSGSKMVFNGTIFTRGDTAQDLYLYRKQVNTSEVSVKPSTVSMNLFDTAELVPTVMYKGKTLDNYELSWTLDSETTNVVTVATSDETGIIGAKATLTAQFPGTANVIVKLLKVGDVDVSGENITTTVPVTVEALDMTISQETLGLYLDKADLGDNMHHSVLKEKDLAVYVSSGEVTRTDVTIEWSCTKDGEVEIVTVENGKVVAKSLGTSTVTARLTHFNGKALPEGLEVSKSCVVTVEENDVKEVALNPTAVAVGWKKSNETEAQQADKITKALDAINVTVTYRDGFSKTMTLGYLSTRATNVSTDISSINLNIQEPKDYTVNVHIDGTYHDYDRNVTVSIVDPSLLNADGIIKEELTLKYQLATEIQDGKEYIIVAFPTDTDKTNGTGVALSNDNATNKDPVQPHAVKVTIGTDSEDANYVTITPEGRTTDTLMKWAFSRQTDGNWYIYNLQHRLTAADSTKLLQARYGESIDANRLYVKKDASSGAFYLTTENPEDPNAPSKLHYVTYDSAWKRETKEIPGAAQQLYLYERVTTTKDVPVRLEVSPQTPINLHAGMTGQAYASVFVGTDAATQWNVLWSSTDETIAKVDPNTGKITPASPVKAGKVEITATLYAANNMEVLSSKGVVTKTVTVNVSDKPVSYSVKVGDVPNGIVTTRLGGKPDYGAVRVVRQCQDHGETYFLLSDPDVELDPLSAVDPITNEAKPLDLTKPGDYKVPVYYLQDANPIGTVTVSVSDDPYLGLNQTNAFPEYPDAGGIRIQKFGTGGKKYLDTGLADVELRVAGVSGKSNVDVVLVVDVSNSMAWSMDWFVGLTEQQVKEAKDPKKIPDTPGEQDKLDLAMTYAQDFADTLLGNGKSGNTLSFVTFAGADLDHYADDGSSTTYADSVKTVFTSVTNAADAKASFAGTKFTERIPNETAGTVECKLTIAGIDGQGLDNANNQTNRGNTNYDYAFGQAMDAVAKVKEKYEETNGKSYEDSGREIHVVFMTDGAPSHYNGIWNKKLATGGKVYATLWGDSTKNRYTAKEYSNTDWLAYIGWYNTLATQLYSQITDMHVVGFDLAHGGYTGFSSDAPSLNKVLQGLVQNRVLNSVQADDTATLEKFFGDLAANLTYSATNAKVTDKIGQDFELFTGIQGDAEHTQKETATISVRSYDLWKASDVGKENGCTADQVGERKNAEGTELETVTFSQNGTVATSSELSGNVLITDENGKTTINAKLFTYDFESMTFSWKIGNVEDKEYTLTYLAYLKLSKDGTENPTPDVLHNTNEIATLDYVDMNGRLAHRVFPVPQLPWDEANIGVRFFLVNSNGDYVNRAGHPFTDKANRVFLPTRQYYNYKLGESKEITAQQAFDAVKVQLGGAANYSLYTDGKIVVIHDKYGTEQGSAVISQVEGDTTTKYQKITAYDLVTNSETTGNFLHTIVDIPVVLENYGTAASPLTADAVVMDFGLPMPIDVITNDSGRTAANQAGTTVEIKMSVMGFVPYAEGQNLSNYIGEYDVKDSLTSEYGTFSTVDGKVRYTPGKILTGLEKVFVAVKLEPSEGQTNTEDFRILLNPLTIVPATVMYYETDDNMAPAFTYSGLWLSDGTQSYDLQDAYTTGEAYGFDSSYIDDGINSNISAKWVEGIDLKSTSVSFTFTGTGFDIISRTGKDQGTIRVLVTNKDTREVKTIVLINKGVKELSQIPVVSVDNLDYGTYTVEIGVLCKQEIPDVFYVGNQFYFDAVRIYGTMTGDEIISSTTAADGTTSTTYVKDIYANDGEANTVFSEIRDNLINAESFGKDGETPGAMFIEGMQDGKNPEPADYAGQGPNNEVYLGNGNAIAFSFNITETNKVLHLGMKSADGNEVIANVTIVQNGHSYPEGGKTIKTSCCTAMFYDLLKQTDFTGTGTVQVVIRNTGNGILSLTDLKYTNGSKFVVTAETLDASNYVNEGTLDVVTVAMPQGVTSVRRAEIVTLRVTTDIDVTDFRITNEYGAVVWSNATKVETDNPDATEITWDVELRPLLLGSHKYTVLGMDESGKYGASKPIDIDVTLY